MRRIMVLGGIAAAALLLSACAPAAPTYDEVHDEAVDAMQRIVDTLPSGTEVEDQSNEPDPCQLGSDTLLSGDGLFFTGHWVAEPGDDFDTQSFIDELPAALGDDFVVDESAIEVTYPAVSFRLANNRDVIIDVGGNRPDEEPFIDIFIISECGTAPAE